LPKICSLCYLLVHQNLPLSFQSGFLAHSSVTPPPILAVQLSILQPSRRSVISRVKHSIKLDLYNRFWTFCVRSAPVE
ncbi:hypothetical protein E1A91_A05G311500v1, partial [Gossypium mustelinum]